MATPPVVAVTIVVTEENHMATATVTPRATTTNHTRCQRCRQLQTWMRWCSTSRKPTSKFGTGSRRSMRCQPRHKQRSDTPGSVGNTPGCGRSVEHTTTEVAACTLSRRSCQSWTSRPTGPRGGVAVFSFLELQRKFRLQRNKRRQCWFCHGSRRLQQRRRLPSWAVRRPCVERPSADYPGRNRPVYDKYDRTRAHLEQQVVRNHGSSVCDG